MKGAERKETERIGAERNGTEKPSMYDCLLASKCPHSDGDIDCGKTRFGKFVSRLGDPSILDDVDILSDLFYIPSTVTMLRSPADKINPLGWWRSARTPAKNEEDELGILRISAIVAFAAMGLEVHDDDDLFVKSDDIEKDYGYGKGEAVKRRAEWLCAIRGSRNFVRASSVGTIMMSLVLRKMGTWAIELFSFLVADATSSQGTKDEPISGIIDDDSHRRRAERCAFPNPGIAPIYASYVAKCIPYLKHVVGGIEHNEPERMKNLRPPVGSETSSANAYWCNCGFSWVLVTVKDEKRVYGFCPVDIISGKGCGKWCIPE